MCVCGVLLLWAVPLQNVGVHGSPQPSTTWPLHSATDSSILLPVLYIDGVTSCLIGKFSIDAQKSFNSASAVFRFRQVWHKAAFTANMYLRSFTLSSKKIAVVERQFYETYPSPHIGLYEKNLLNIAPRMVPQLFSKSFIYLIWHKRATPSEDETHIDGFIVLSIRQVCY